MLSISKSNSRVSLLMAMLMLSPLTAVAITKQKNISVNFEAVVADQPFACGQSYQGIGLSKSRITPADFRMYVSEIELIDDKGYATPIKLKQEGIWQYQNTVLLDFENGSGPCVNGNSGLNTAVVGTVPNKHYKGLRFTLGVPAKLNHGDATTAAAPLNVTSMFWTWRAGYKFLRLEMATSGFPELPKLKVKSADGKPVETEEKDGPETVIAESDSKPSVLTDKNDADKAKMVKKKRKIAGFPVHLGSANCVSPSKTTPALSCANPNRITVSFDDFNSDKNSIVVDIASLLKETNVDYTFTNAGCMSDTKDADCKGIMSNFGAPFNDQPAYPQDFMRVK